MSFDNRFLNSDATGNVFGVKSTVSVKKKFQYTEGAFVDFIFCFFCFSIYIIIGCATSIQVFLIPFFKLGDFIEERMILGLERHNFKRFFEYQCNEKQK